MKRQQREQNIKKCNAMKRKCINERCDLVNCLRNKVDLANFAKKSKNVGDKLEIAKIQIPLK